VHLLLLDLHLLKLILKLLDDGAVQLLLLLKAFGVLLLSLARIKA
jgi:hypothetical protein